MRIFIRRDRLLELGGFNENVILVEDVELTSQIKKKIFFIVNKHVLTTSRCFEKKGYAKTKAIYTKTFFSKSFRHQNNAFYFEDVTR